MANRVIASLSLLTHLLLAGPAQAEPWIAGDVDRALDIAQRSERRVLVYVTASWCSTCQDLKREVLEAPAHEDLIHSFVPVRVDFDLPSSRKWVESLVILGLPTVVVLDANGSPVGRIRGFESPETWTQELALLERRVDVREEVEAVGRSAGATAADRLALARLLLERGETREGLNSLGAIAASEDPQTAPEALFLLGRYHHRVRQSPAKARPLWRELALRFPASPYAGGAWWWYARSEADLGTPSIGARLLLDAALRQPEEPGHARRAAAFLKKHPHLLPALRAEVTRAIESALEHVAPGPSRDRLEAMRP